MGADGVAGTQGTAVMSERGRSDPTSCLGVSAGPPPARRRGACRSACTTRPGSPRRQLPPDLAANPPIVHMALYLQRSCHNQNTVLYGVGGYITFRALFDGDPNETSADDKLTDATFDAQFGDLSDVPIGDYAEDVPPGLRSRFCGNFRFYFERGQPAQPFP